MEAPVSTGERSRKGPGKRAGTGNKAAVAAATVTEIPRFACDAAGGYAMCVGEANGLSRPFPGSPQYGGRLDTRPGPH